MDKSTVFIDQNFVHFALKNISFRCLIKIWIRQISKSISFDLGFIGRKPSGLDPKERESHSPFNYDNRFAEKR